MCMGRAFKRKSDITKAINRLKTKSDFVRVYKVVRIENKKYTPVFVKGYHKSGICGAIMGNMWFTSKTLPTFCSFGYHAFRDIESAKKYLELCTRTYRTYQIIECLALPEWIKSVGSSFDGKKTISFNYICLPEYPNRKVTTRFFRKCLKKWRKKHQSKK